MDSQGNVIPAKAGIQEAKLQVSAESSWMPAPSRTWDRLRGHDGNLFLKSKLTEH